ncbi:MAG: hypothetical protein ACKVU1_18420 [bacterium]
MVRGARAALGGGVHASVFAVALALALAAFNAGCGGGDTNAPPLDAPAGPLTGVSLSPRSFTLDGISDFIARAREAGTVVSWAGAWSELDVAGAAPAVVAAIARGEGFVPLVETAFYNPATERLILPLSPLVRADYKRRAVAYADSAQPRYLALGIEVNLVADVLPADFELFVALFNETYDAIKTVSPSTQVFTIFQLEQMKGLRGGLFGGTNDTTAARWDLLDRFAKSDLVGFTTYPGLIHKNPSEIPADYYAEIASRTTKPIAFTELGWHVSATIPEWESDEAEQAAFVARFADLAAPLGSQTEMVIWSFLYDAGLPEPFVGMGLRRDDGSARPAWDAWLAQIAQP